MIVSKSEPDPTEAEDEQGVENMVSSVKWYSLPAAEKDTVELLRAVNFWEKGVSTSIDSSFDCKSLLDSMLMCAAILRLCQKVIIFWVGKGRGHRSQLRGRHLTIASIASHFSIPC